MGLFQIHFISGECKGEVRTLSEGAPLLMGRSRSATIRFLSPDISGKHLELTLLPTGMVALKNLSSHRTELNGQPLSEGEAAVLSEGDRVLLGDATSFVFEPVSEGGVNTPEAVASEVTCATNFAAAPAAVLPSAVVSSRVEPPKRQEEAKTEIPEPEPPEPIVPAQNDRTEIPEPQPVSRPEPVAKPSKPTPLPEEDEGKTSQVDLSSDNETMMMQTRVASMDEMELLRKTRKPKMQKWVVLLAAGMLASATLVAISYAVSQTHIENPLTWPKEGDKFNDEVVIPDIGVEKDLIIYFPRHRTMKVVKEPNRIMALTRIGKRRDVPCRIIFNMNRSSDNLSLSRKKGFATWQEKMMAAGGQWNFDADPQVYFRGKDHGLPYQMARYTRSVDKEVWFGVVMYIKDRDWELILQREIPSSERYRGELLLVDTPFMSISPRYVMNHWEPGDVLLERPVQGMLDEAKQLLDRAIPLPRMWPHILNLLRNILAESLKTNDTATYSEAMDLLRDLRVKQSKWLNNQTISYKAYLSKDMGKQAAMIRQDCVTVFADEDDLRCHQLRNNEWK
jgi:FHA domain